MADETRTTPDASSVDESTKAQATPSPASAEAVPAHDAVEEQQRVEHDLDALLAKAQERDEYLALAQRTQADFENYRKRMQREGAAAEQRGIAKLARELLPALDTLALALDAARKAADDQAGADAAQLQQGIELVHGELTQALARAGVEGYSPQGERFDPEWHEAMAKQPVDGVESGTVAEVYQRGYRIDGTVLRPARVVVAE